MWARRNTPVSLGRVPGCRSGPAAGPSGSRPRGAGPRLPVPAGRRGARRRRASPRSVRQTRSAAGRHRPHLHHLRGHRPGVRDREGRSPDGGAESVREARGVQQGRGGGTVEDAGVAEEQGRLRVGRARQTSAIGPACTIDRRASRQGRRPPRRPPRGRGSPSPPWCPTRPGSGAGPRRAASSPASRALSGSIEQQEARGGGQGSGESHPLALTTRQGRRQPLGEPGEADQVEQLGDPGGHRRRGAYADAQRVGDVAGHRRGGRAGRPGTSGAIPRRWVGSSTRPARATARDRRGSIPAIARSRVDLPQPEGRGPPGRGPRPTSRSASTTAGTPPYDTDRPCTESTAIRRIRPTATRRRSTTSITAAVRGTEHDRGGEGHPVR